MSSSSSDEAKPTFATLLEALELSLAFTPVAVFRMALLDSSLNASAADMRMLLEMLLLFSDSDSEAAVEADADLLSLAAALALSLELPRWLLLCETESDMDSDVETLVWLRSLVLAETDVARAVAPEATAAGAAPPTPLLPWSSYPACDFLPAVCDCAAEQCLRS